jgi:hypothetical protein
MGTDQASIDNELAKIAVFQCLRSGSHTFLMLHLPDGQVLTAQGMLVAIREFDQILMEVVRRSGKDEAHAPFWERGSSLCGCNIHSRHDLGAYWQENHRIRHCMSVPTGSIDWRLEQRHLIIVAKQTVDFLKMLNRRPISFKGSPSMPYVL